MVDHITIRKWQRPPPFADYLGIKTISAENGLSTIELPDRVEVGNRKGDVHGGAISTLADIAVGTAVRSSLEGLFSISSVNLNVSFLRPARGRLMAKGKVLRLGRRLAYSEAVIVDDAGELVASASSTIAIIRPREEQSS